MQLTRHRFRMFTLLSTVALGFYCGHETPEAPPEKDVAAQSTSALRNGAVESHNAALLETLYSQQQKLLADDKASSDYLGRSVAISADGNLAIVGAWNKSDGTLFNSGAAYVFVRSGATWTEEQKLSASDAASGDHFGIAVAISADGSTAIIGADLRSDGGLTASGAAYVFARSGSTFSEQQKLTASDAGSYDNLGGALALSKDGNIAILGAPNKAVSAVSGFGAAYLFARSGSTFTQQQELLASDGASPDLFGCSVALSGDGNTALIGADGKSDGALIANGAAYVFARGEAGFHLQQKFIASDASDGSNFGKSVALSGDGNQAIVGAYKKTHDGMSQSGGAYLLSRSGSIWTEQQIVTASDAAPVDRFGYSVALSSDGTTALIGSYFNSEGGLGKSGAAYLLSRSGTSFTQQQKVLSLDRAASEFFGVSVALSATGGTALIGADSKSDSGTIANGAAYAFIVPPTKSNGSACAAAGECKSGFCADGVCCDTACGDGATSDCQACSKARGAAADGVCGAIAAGSICRAAAGTCDVAEACDGTATACPSDGLVSAGLTCRAAAGACDVAEVCSGLSPACPADGYKPIATLCRAAAGACDLAEVCSGASPQCPSDGVVAAGTICRAAAGACDVAEACSGVSPQCPNDGLTPAGTVCRAATGPCDAAEVCSGASAACPADKFKPAATVCRASAGPCDSAEKCSGSAAACPADKFKSNTTVCRAAAGSCDIAEFCSGSAAACPPDQYKPLLVVCRPAVGGCDLTDYCTGGSPACPPDDFLPGGTICRPATNQCDLDEACSGSSAVCPLDRHESDGTPCTGGTCKAGICM